MKEDVKNQLVKMITTNMRTKLRNAHIAVDVLSIVCKALATPLQLLSIRNLI